MDQPAQDQAGQDSSPATETERDRDAQKLADFLNDALWESGYLRYLFSRLVVDGVNYQVGTFKP